MTLARKGPRPARGRWREWGLAALTLAPLALVVALAPIPQDPRYHLLADTRTIFGVPNFANVLSNLPFLLVGLAGLLHCLSGEASGAVRSWLVYFAGVTLVFFGSAWYHLSPEDSTLAWDRLPITIAFMGLLVALAAEHTRASVERALLAPAVALGAASVGWWAWTGDLRFYVWVQAAPLAAIVYFLAACPARYSRRAYLVWGLCAYAAAKAAEFHDARIHALTANVVSGHTLKHLAAALAACFVYLMLRGRRVLPDVAPQSP
ncbi:MAG: ceramidase domain-containing protein [Burkholderiales bacterium]|nr:ceramidase domain-containing protein [Burkholderiales bacterium]